MAAAAPFTNEESARLMKMVCRFKQVLPKVSIDWEWLKRNGNNFDAFVINLAGFVLVFKFNKYSIEQIEEKYKSICRELELEDDEKMERKVQLMANEFAEKNKGNEMSEEEEIEKIRQMALTVSPATLYHEEFANFLGYFENSTIGRNFDVYVKRLEESLNRIPGRDVEDGMVWPTDDNTWELEYWQAMEEIEKLKRTDVEECKMSRGFENENKINLEEKQGSVVSTDVAGTSTMLHPAEEGQKDELGKQEKKSDDTPITSAKTDTLDGEKVIG